MRVDDAVDDGEAEAGAARLEREEGIEDGGGRRGDAVAVVDDLDDGERAAALREEGLVIARDLGMRPLMERILSRREFLKA